MHPEFQSGHVSTHFIGKHISLLTKKIPVENDLYEIAKTLKITSLPENKHPFDDLSGWRPNLLPKTDRVVYVNSDEVSLPIAIEALSDGHISPWKALPEGTLITVGNRPYLVSSHGEFGQQLSSADSLSAPMPGKIIAVNAKVGDSVKAGDALIIMEAMKMEMTLEAPRDGVVAEVPVVADALVTDGEILLSLEEIEKDK